MRRPTLLALLTTLFLPAAVAIAVAGRAFSLPPLDFDIDPFEVELDLTDRP